MVHTDLRVVVLCDRGAWMEVVVVVFFRGVDCKISLRFNFKKCLINIHLELHRGVELRGGGGGGGGVYAVEITRLKLLFGHLDNDQNNFYINLCFLFSLPFLYYALLGSIFRDRNYLLLDYVFLYTTGPKVIGFSSWMVKARWDNFTGFAARGDLDFDECFKCGHSGHDVTAGILIMNVSLNFASTMYVGTIICRQSICSALDAEGLILLLSGDGYDVFLMQMNASADKFGFFALFSGLF
ncbi:hypothetical protein ACJX0J_014941 [Zea mays]